MSPEEVGEMPHFLSHKWWVFKRDLHDPLEQLLGLCCTRTLYLMVNILSLLAELQCCESASPEAAGIQSPYVLFVAVAESGPVAEKDPVIAAPTPGHLEPGQKSWPL